jgi:tricorn protease-like protein
MDLMKSPKVVGRFTRDIALWKRYRGGQNGVIFIDASGTGEFQYGVRIGAPSLFLILQMV